MESDTLYRTRSDPLNFSENKMSNVKSQSSFKSDTKLFEKDNLFNEMQDEILQLRRDYELEKASRTEAEKAFKNIKIMYETATKKMNEALSRSTQAFDITNQMKTHYLEQKELSEKNICQLENANATINMFKQILTREKRKADRLRNEIHLIKKTTVDHSTCEEILDQETREKENVLNKNEQLSHQLEEIRNERDLAKKSNREMKVKMTDIINIRKELEQQNKTLLYQRDTYQCLITDKDKQIEKIMSHLEKDIMQDPNVLLKIASIKENHCGQQKILENEITSLKADIIELNKRNAELKSMIDGRTSNFAILCENHKALQTEHDCLKKKLESQISDKEQCIISIIEVAKAMKNELNDLKETNGKQNEDIAGLKEQMRLKDVEISVLGEAKLLYEDKINEFQCEKEAMRQIAEEFEGQLDCTKSSMKDLENYKYAIERQLREAQEELQIQEENNYIQEKILEDNRDTVKLLRCRLKECCQKMHKCEREKEMLQCRIEAF